MTLTVQPEADAVDPVGDVGQPLGAQAGELPEDGGVDLVDESRHRLRRTSRRPTGRAAPAAATSQTVPVVPMLRGSGGAHRSGAGGGALRRAVGGPATASAGVVRGDVVDGHAAARRRATRLAVERIEPVACTPGVELAQVVRVQPLPRPRRAPRPGAPRTDRPQSRRTSGVTFSAGCSARSSISSTRSPVPIAGSVLKSKRDVDDAGVERLVGQRTAGVERRRPPRTRCRRPRAGRRGRADGSRTRVARRRSAGATPHGGRSVRVSPSRSATSRRTTKALASCAGAGARARATVPSQRLDECGVGRRDVGLGMRPADAQELHRGPGVLRARRRRALAQRGRDELARPEVERPPHAEPGALQRLAVDLGEQLALGEVERCHRDDVAPRRRRRGPRAARLPRRP